MEGRFPSSSSTAGAPLSSAWAAEAAAEAGPAGFAGGGYSRRCPPGDAKSTDRRRLLADRNAYISYLEAQVERANEAALEAESVSSGLRHVRLRVEQLESRFGAGGGAGDCGRQPPMVAAPPPVAREASEALMEPRAAAPQQARAPSSASPPRAAALPPWPHPAAVAGGGFGACARSQEGEEELLLLTSRVRRLESAVSEARLIAEAETARLRNEVSLAVQELGQRLDERARALHDHLDGRVQVLHNFADDGAAAVIREAQATCARLADDALAAAEASQRKVGEVARHGEACQTRLEELARGTEVELAALRAELASTTASSSATAAAVAVLRSSPLSSPRTAGLSREVGGPCPRGAVPGGAAGLTAAALPEDVVEGLADVLERRLATRLSAQVLQLSEVLRRVVQAQVALHQQVSGLPGAALSAGTLPQQLLQPQQQPLQQQQQWPKQQQQQKQQQQRQQGQQRQQQHHPQQHQ